LALLLAALAPALVDDRELDFAADPLVGALAAGLAALAGALAVVFAGALAAGLAGAAVFAGAGAGAAGFAAGRGPPVRSEKEPGRCGGADSAAAAAAASRAAGDGELPALVERCLSGELTTADAVKREVRDWRPDFLRA